MKKDLDLGTKIFFGSAIATIASGPLILASPVFGGVGAIAFLVGMPLGLVLTDNKN